MYLLQEILGYGCWERYHDKEKGKLNAKKEKCKGKR